MILDFLIELMLSLGNFDLELLDLSFEVSYALLPFRNFVQAVFYLFLDLFFVLRKVSYYSLVIFLLLLDIIVMIFFHLSYFCLIVVFLLYKTFN